jgi:hypothetical protein
MIRSIPWSNFVVVFQVTLPRSPQQIESLSGSFLYLHKKFNAYSSTSFFSKNFRVKLQNRL